MKYNAVVIFGSVALATTLPKITDLPSISRPFYFSLISNNTLLSLYKVQLIVQSTYHSIHNYAVTIMDLKTLALISLASLVYASTQPGLTTDQSFCFSCIGA